MKRFSLNASCITAARLTNKIIDVGLQNQGHSCNLHVFLPTNLVSMTQRHMVVQPAVKPAMLPNAVQIVCVTERCYIGSFLSLGGTNHVLHIMALLRHASVACAIVGIFRQSQGRNHEQVMTSRRLTANFHIGEIPGCSLLAKSSDYPILNLIGVPILFQYARCV